MKLLAYIASMFATSGFVWYLFERTDTIAKEKIRESTTQFLRNLEIGLSLNLWNNHFCNAFDTVFGKQHISIICFLRSSIATMLSSILTFLIYLTIRPENISLNSLPDMIKLMFIATFTINIIMDYVSLLETRWIIKLIGHNPKTIRIFVLLLFDLILTLLIFSIFSILLFPIFASVYFDEIITLQEVIPVILLVLKNNTLFVGPPPAVMGIIFYTTFSTSFWVYLFALSCLAIISISKIQKPWAYLRDNFLNIESKPILVIGWFATLFIVAIYLIALPFIF